VACTRPASVASTRWRATDLDNGDIFAWSQSDLGQGIAGNKIGGGAETADRHRTPLELLRGFDIGARHQVVVQRSNAPRHDDRVRAGEHTVDHRRPCDLTDRRVGRNQRHDRRGPAGEVDQLHIESVFLKDPSLLSHPCGKLVAADGAVAHVDPEELGVGRTAQKRDQKKKPGYGDG
jgi:hypothetical protein